MAHYNISIQVSGTLWGYLLVITDDRSYISIYLYLKYFHPRLTFVFIIVRLSFADHFSLQIYSYVLTLQYFLCELIYIYSFCILFLKSNHEWYQILESWKFRSFRVQNSNEQLQHAVLVNSSELTSHVITLNYCIIFSLNNRPYLSHRYVRILYMVVLKVISFYP